jgi:hypothetical protein
MWPTGCRKKLPHEVICAEALIETSIQCLDCNKAPEA